MAAVLDKHMNGRQFVVGDSATVPFRPRLHSGLGQCVKMLEAFRGAGHRSRMYDRPHAPARIAKRGVGGGGGGGWGGGGGGGGGVARSPLRKKSTQAHKKKRRVIGRGEPKPARTAPFFTGAYQPVGGSPAGFRYDQSRIRYIMDVTRNKLDSTLEDQGVICRT